MLAFVRVRVLARVSVRMCARGLVCDRESVMQRIGDDSAGCSPAVDEKTA
jgi:hypothetical protein